MKRSSIRQKENVPYACQPRASLRMSMTAKKKTQKCDGRMSVLPLKRQRLSVNLETYQMTDSRPSLRTNINLINTVNMTPMHSCQRSIRKETIINNLVNKLDEQQEIRSIIETKLKRNSYGPNKQFMYTSQFQPYSSNNSLQVSQKNLTQQLANLMDNNTSQFNGTTNRFDSRDNNDQSAVTILSSKLRQCQDELDYFKSIVNEMSKKMKLIQRDQTNSSKVANYAVNKQKRDSLRQNNHRDSHQNYLSSNMKTERCANCRHCQCGGSIKGRLVDVNTQTENEEKQISGMCYKGEQRGNYEFDFFDNLDRTLKILSQSKNL